MHGFFRYVARLLCARYYPRHIFFLHENGMFLLKIRPFSVYRTIEKVPNQMHEKHSFSLFSLRSFYFYFQTISELEISSNALFSIEGPFFRIENVLVMRIVHTLWWDDLIIFNYDLIQFEYCTVFWCSFYEWIQLRRPNEILTFIISTLK